MWHTRTILEASGQEDAKDDDHKRTAGKKWLQIAQDRNEWHILKESSTNEGSKQAKERETAFYKPLTVLPSVGP
ncbi:unnamed protein product [Arctia plantaginis]|uniref:Uncharacterized protein n=1 Tax=Arctia plantaginis TaxID=874455 RepID=A0A8S1ACP8_ARCPL|nr:unnamed protein product [Arctia plantaginis]